MGSGKTTVGEALAKAIGWNFIDTDSVIVERARKPIYQIFSEDGEKHFRGIESEVVQEVCELESTVISFGGGVLLDPQNTAMITKSTVIVLLQASIDSVLSRTSSDHTRPLLEVGSELRRERIMSLLSERAEQYRETADMEFDTDEMNVDEIISEITRRMGN